MEGQEFDAIPFTAHQDKPAAMDYTKKEFEEAQGEVVADMEQEAKKLEDRVRASVTRHHQVDGIGISNPGDEIEARLRKSENEMISEFYDQITEKKKEIETSMYKGWKGAIKKRLTKGVVVSDRQALEKVIKDYIIDSEKLTQWHKKDWTDQETAYAAKEKELSLKQEYLGNDIILYETLDKKLKVYETQLSHNSQQLSEHISLASQEGYNGEADVLIDSEKKAITSYNGLIRKTRTAIETIGDNLLDYQDSIEYLKNEVENIKAARNDSKESYRAAKNSTDYLKSVLNDEQQKDSMVSRYRKMAASDIHFGGVWKLVEIANKQKELHYQRKNGEQKPDTGMYSLSDEITQYNHGIEKTRNAKIEQILANKHMI